MSDLAIYRLEALVDSGNTKWGRTVFRGDALVRAFSMADARVIASEALTATNRFEEAAFYDVTEVNYGEAFRKAGPRQLILASGRRLTDH